jgi:nucleoside-diphosphate-sugar epimerase
MRMRSLIIGGTRNLGPSIVHALLQRGDEVTVFNRGQTHDDLPQEIERLRGDRTDPKQFRAGLASREFDLVIDTTLYTGSEAEAAVELFGGKVGRYIFLSTGQVYLLRTRVERPFKEKDYSGPVMAEPSKTNASDYENWLYGHDKREAEDVFDRAWSEQKFPFTSLRLPMVNSERDHFDRMYGYFLRIQDGGPVLIPDEAGLPVRHVYGDDVVQAIVRLTRSELGKGCAYNIAQDETLSLAQFLELLASAMHRPLKIARIPREELVRAGLLPHCSPFSGRWMSSLENALSKADLGMEYTPVATYVRKLVSYFQAVPARRIEGYAQRERELEVAKSK